VRPILPRRSRRLVTATTVAVVAMALGAVTAARLHAVFAEQPGDTTEQQAGVRAESTAGTTAPSTTQLWTDAVAHAREEIDSADTVLTDSQDMVADNAVRLALAAAILQVRSILADPPALPSDQDVAALVDATTRVTQATTTVDEAQTAWRTDHDANAETADSITDRRP
jgi:hypothetical protein